jgi:hypothetical protein
MDDLCRVPGFSDDVFVSYARVNDRDYESWVGYFVDDLEANLDSVLRRKSSIWQDRSEIRRGEAFSPLIERGSKGAAVFVALMSGSYLDRPWCRQEIDCFYETRSGADPLWLNHRSRIVPIWLEDLSGLGSKPWEAVRMADINARGEPYLFFEKSKGGSSHRYCREGSNKDDYQKTIVDLALHIKNILMDLDDDARRAGPLAYSMRSQMRFPGRPVVFLCPSLGSGHQPLNDGLDALRNDTAARLTQERVDVVQVANSRDKNQWKEEMQAALDVCDSCVQLLWSAPGGNGSEALAFDKAVAECARQAVEARRRIHRPVRRVVWISSTITRNSSDRRDSNGYGSFIEEIYAERSDSQCDVLECDTRALHTEVMNFLASEPASQSEEPLDAIIYVAHHARDEVHAKCLVKQLKTLGARNIQSPALPDPGTPTYDKKVKSVHRGLLDASNGVLVVLSGDDDTWLYKHNVTWIDGQVAKRNRNARVNLKRRGIYAAPPRLDSSPPGGLYRHDWEIISPRDVRAADSEPNPVDIKHYLDELRRAMKP